MSEQYRFLFIVWVLTAGAALAGWIGLVYQRDERLRIDSTLHTCEGLLFSDSPANYPRLKKGDLERRK